MKRIKTLLILLVIFFSGAICGGVITAKWIQKQAMQGLHGGPEQVVRMTMRRLSWELGLDSKQQNAVRPIVLDTLRQIHAIRLQSQPQMSRVLDETEERMKPILKPDQMEKLKELRQRLRPHQETELDAALESK